MSRFAWLRKSAEIIETKSVIKDISDISNNVGTKVEAQIDLQVSDLVSLPFMLGAIVDEKLEGAIVDKKLELIKYEVGEQIIEVNGVESDVNSLVQATYKLLQVKATNAMALPELNIGHWVCRALVNRAHDEWFNSFGGYAIDNVELAGQRLLDSMLSGFGRHYFREDMLSW